MLFNLLIALSGFVYVILNILQSAFVVAQRRDLVSFLHFFVALLWVFIVVSIVREPITNGVAYAIGSSIGMLCSGYFNNTLVVMTQRKN